MSGESRSMPKTVPRWVQSIVPSIAGSQSSGSADNDTSAPAPAPAPLTSPV
ncbi:hypothetical protein NHJ13734_008468, partial [Beauveria thailandica]